MTPSEAAEKAFNQVNDNTASMGDEDYLEALAELADLCSTAASAKREEMG